MKLYNPCIFLKILRMQETPLTLPVEAAAAPCARPNTAPQI
jgi:hypothetical protein